MEKLEIVEARSTEEKADPKPVSGYRRRRERTRWFIKSAIQLGVVFLILFGVTWCIHLYGLRVEHETRAKRDLEKWGSALGSYLESGGEYELLLDMNLDELEAELERAGDLQLNTTFAGDWEFSTLLHIYTIEPGDAAPGQFYPFSASRRGRTGGFAADGNGESTSFSDRHELWG